MKIKNPLFCFLFAYSVQVVAQPSTALFSRADSLRGRLTPLRTCYDINYYHLDVKMDIANRSISGSNEFRFTATQDFDRLQFDLFENLSVYKIVYRGAELAFTREFNAVFVSFPNTIKKGSRESFTVYYGGKPTVAKNAPWDGGFIFKKDAEGNPWVAVACQGFGASSWWPNKDHQSDEVDSMLISISVPDTLEDVSNGRLQSKVKLADGYMQYNWLVSYPINNYDVTFNVGKFAHFSDTFESEKGPLTLDFHVLKENLAKAKTHFAADVKPMLKCFEYWFGPYPFYRDGYKLVESPHLGMEHQSAVAYGNKYLKGYLGRDLSGTGLGLTWDFIIVHESGHEWFGNNVTSKDIADMWIHEGFTNYSESLFVECTAGKEAGAKYVNGVRKNIQNDRPIIGPYEVNQEGSGDMYYKGGNLLHTLRTIINNDEKWRQILRGINTTFGLKTCTTQQIEQYISKQAHMNFNPVFDQYLRHAGIPVLEYKLMGKKLSFRWISEVKNFNMPVDVQINADEKIRIKPKTKMKSKTIKQIDADHFKVDDFNFFIETKNLN
ncbi:MAG: M1 family metallopeptidase [Sphingobacteriaceae bacterium]